MRKITHEQIDRINECMLDGDMVKLAEFVNDKELKVKVLNALSNDKFEFDLREELIKNLMTQIENEGYEYFYNKIQFNQNLANLLAGVNDIEKIKYCVKDKKNVF